MKRLFIDGKYYRWRRGRLVEIPEEWRGVIPFDRGSKTRKLARLKRRNKNTRIKRDGWSKS